MVNDLFGFIEPRCERARRPEGSFKGVKNKDSRVVVFQGELLNVPVQTRARQQQFAAPFVPEVCTRFTATGSNYKPKVFVILFNSSILFS